MPIVFVFKTVLIIGVPLKGLSQISENLSARHGLSRHFHRKYSIWYVRSAQKVLKASTRRPLSVFTTSLHCSRRSHGVHDVVCCVLKAHLRRLRSLRLFLFGYYVQPILINLLHTRIWTG